MFVLRDKISGEYINDFQEKATPEGLLKNAQVAGLDVANLDVIEVNQTDFELIKSAVIGPIQALEEARIISERAELLAIAETVRQKLGLTRFEMKQFIKLVREMPENIM